MDNWEYQTAIPGKASEYICGKYYHEETYFLTCFPCMPKSRFPQNFPPHLNSLSTIEPLSGCTPLGNHPLQFEDMHARQFEQICWWLLQRDYDIEGCQLIGGTGRTQGCIDLFGYAQNDKAQLIVLSANAGKASTLLR